MQASQKTLVKTALFIGALAITSAGLAADYAIRNKFKLGGDGGWDYLTYDAPSNRLFISRGNRVQVVDPQQGVVLGEIADTPGVHGIAIANDLGLGFTSNGRANTVTTFSLATLKPVKSSMAGTNPDFIAYDPATQRVVAFNGQSHDATVIDAKSGERVATIPLSGKPEAAVADGRGMMFVDIEDKNELSAIDLRKGTVVSSSPLAGCNEPAGLAIDAKSRRLFVGCHNRTLLVVDADTRNVMASLPIGEGVDATVFDDETRRVFSSQGDGTLTIVREEGSGRFGVEQTVQTQRGARTMALNPKTHEVYLVTADFEEAPPATGQSRPRRVMKPDSFTLLVVGERK